MVFLAPTKKGLRNPILKCKNQLASLMSISDCHQSAAQSYLLINFCSFSSADPSLLKMLHQSTCQVFFFTCHIIIMSSVEGITVIFNLSSMLLHKHGNYCHQHCLHDKGCQRLSRHCHTTIDFKLSYFSSSVMK